MNDPLLCPWCHGEIAASASKCRHCGEWVTESPDGIHPQSDDQKIQRIPREGCYLNTMKCCCLYDFLVWVAALIAIILAFYFFRDVAMELFEDARQWIEETV